MAILATLIFDGLASSAGFCRMGGEGGKVGIMGKGREFPDRFSYSEPEIRTGMPLSYWSVSSFALVKNVRSIEILLSTRTFR